MGVATRENGLSYGLLIHHPRLPFLSLRSALVLRSQALETQQVGEHSALDGRPVLEGTQDTCPSWVLEQGLKSTF